MSLRPSAQDQKEQKDKKKQRRKMVRAKKKKERTKEAFAALKALKEQKAEANAVDRPADTIDVNRPDAVAAHAGVKAESLTRKRKGAE